MGWMRKCTASEHKMTQNFQLWKAVLIAMLAASFTLFTFGIYTSSSLGVAAAASVLLVLLLIRNKQTIIDNFAFIEARYYSPNQRDEKVWGMRPRYEDVAAYLPILSALLGFYLFSSAIDAANGFPLGRLDKLVFALAGIKGVVFMRVILGVILCDGAIEFTYYLRKRNKANAAQKE